MIHHDSTAYDWATALVVVDVQNDFADPAGSMYVRGGELVIPTINAEVTRAVEADAPVVYTQDWHPQRTPHFQTDGGPWPPHCIRDTWGAAIHPEVLVRGERVRKGSGGQDGYSGFTMRDPRSGEEEATDLEAMLRERAVAKVVIVGLATDYCVKETALDAAGKGFAIVVVANAVRSVDLRPGDGELALQEMLRGGVTVV